MILSGRRCSGCGFAPDDDYSRRIALAGSILGGYDSPVDIATE
jgi:hypothetical protein